MRPSHGLDDRRRAVGATVIVALLTAPHAEETRAQYCVAAVTGAVISVGELRPTGFVKSNTGPWYHYLYHGTTLHGQQDWEGGPKDEPLTYYHHSGPIGQVFAAERQQLAFECR